MSGALDRRIAKVGGASSYIVDNRASLYDGKVGLALGLVPDIVVADENGNIGTEARDLTAVIDSFRAPPTGDPKRRVGESGRGTAAAREARGGTGGIGGAGMPDRTGDTGGGDAVREMDVVRVRTGVGSGRGPAGTNDVRVRVERRERLSRGCPDKGDGVSLPGESRASAVVEMAGAVIERTRCRLSETA